MTVTLSMSIDLQHAVDDGDNNDALFIDLSQKELLAIDTVAVISSVLSICGSMAIFRLIMKERQTAGVELTSHHRFLAALSLFDILGSLGRYTLLPWMGTATPSRSCTLQGAMLLVTAVPPLYNLSLSFFYCSMIRWRIPAKVFAARYECWGHAASVGVPLSFLVLLLVFHGFNPTASIPSCGMSAYPPGCDAADSTVPCQRGQVGASILFYGYIPVFVLVLVGLITNNVLIFLYVRRLEQRNLHWRRAHSMGMGTSPAATTTAADAGGGDEEIASNTNTNINLNNGAVAATTHTLERAPSGADRQEAFRRTRLVATQSFLYVGAYFICFIWPLVGGALSMHDPTGLRRGKYFGWLLGMHICMPAQGFLNALIYLRGRIGESLLQQTTSSSSASSSSFSLRSLRSFRRAKSTLSTKAKSGCRGCCKRTANENQLSPPTLGANQMDGTAAANS